MLHFRSTDIDSVSERDATNVQILVQLLKKCHYINAKENSELAQILNSDIAKANLKYFAKQHPVDKEHLRCVTILTQTEHFLIISQMSKNS